MLTNEIQLRDRTLCLKLSELASHDRDYWAFRGNARRDHGHGMMQYPAMMVPQMVRALLGSICEVEGTDIARIADPFVGSGNDEFIKTQLALSALRCRFTNMAFRPAELISIE